MKATIPVCPCQPSQLPFILKTRVRHGLLQQVSPTTAQAGLSALCFSAGLASAIAFFTVH